LYVLSTEYIYVFCVDLRTNIDYVLYSINWMVFITATGCFYIFLTVHLRIILVSI